MKALVHEQMNGIEGLSFKDTRENEPKQGEVKVKLRVAGLNHRDLAVLQRHKGEDPPVIIGSDGAGIIETVGEGVGNFSVGDEVIINPSLGWIDKSEAPPNNFSILGFPSDGTFSEKIVISANNIEPKLDYLTWEEAGVFSLAALTGYRALFTRAKVKSSDTVLLPGVGGGVVTLLLLFAKAIGARVIITSRSEEKRRKALELGADVAIDSESDWNESLNGEKVDIVIETVGAATFTKSLHQLRNGGTLVTFGASAGDETMINIREFFYGQYNLLGTTMGSRDEFREVLQFMNQHKIKPIIDTSFPLKNGREALERLGEAKQLGKIALTIKE